MRKDVMNILIAIIEATHCVRRPLSDQGRKRNLKLRTR